MAVPVRQSVIFICRQPSPRSELKGLELGVKAYQAEYSRLPSLDSPPPPEDNNPGYDTASKEGHGIIKILLGEDTPKNPRQIPFYEPSGRNGRGGGYSEVKGLVDTWGTKGYIIIFDYDGNGEISDPEHPGSRISSSVIIYSAGADGDYSTWHDNITSWER